MAKKIKDLCVKVGSYESGGKQKNRYLNVGHVLQMDNGGEMYLLNRTFNPAGCPNPDNRDTVILSVFETKEKTAEPVVSANTVVDEIPF